MIEAALIPAGAFVVIAVITLAVVQRRKPPLASHGGPIRRGWPPRSRRAAGWGVGAVAMTMLIAAFAIGALIPRMPRRPPKNRD